MPFLAAIGPGLGALLGGGAAAAGGLASSLINRSGQQSIANQQQNLAQQQLARSQPAYNQAYSYYQNILNGGSAMQGALAAPLGQINNQFDQAYKNTLNNAYTRGGALDKALRTVQTGRAFSLSDLYGQAQQGAIQGLTGLAGGDQSNAAAVLGSAQQSQVQNNQMNAQALSGVGSILTRLLSNPNLFSRGSSGGGSTPSDTPLQLPTATPTNYTFNQLGYA